MFNHWQLLPALGKKGNIYIKVSDPSFGGKISCAFRPRTIAGCSSDGKGPPLPVLSSRFLAVHFTCSQGLSWWNPRRQRSNISEVFNKRRDVWALAYLRTWPPLCRPLDPMTLDFCRTFVCSRYWHSLISGGQVSLPKHVLLVIQVLIVCLLCLILGRCLDAWGWPIATAGAICPGPHTGISAPHRFDANQLPKWVVRLSVSWRKRCPKCLLALRQE